MTLKKFAALFVALVMAVSVMGITAFAAEKSNVELKLSGSVYEGDPFTVDVYVTPRDGVSTMRAFQIDFTYDATKVEIVYDEESGDFAKINGYKASEVMVGTSAIDEETGEISYAFTPNFSRYDTLTAPTATNALVSFSFKAKENVSGNVVKTVNKFVYLDVAGGTEEIFAADSATATNSTVLGNLVVQEIPNLPSIAKDSAEVIGDLKVGTKATAKYTFHNGNKTGETFTDGDASIIKWYTSDDEELTKGKDDAYNELTITEDMVGETLYYTALANVERDLNPTAKDEDMVTSKASIMVMPADTYAPKATLALDKVTIGKAVELDYKLNKYAVGADASTYEWYVVADEETATKIVTDKAIPEGTTAVEGMTTADPTFTKELDENIKGKWAVVKVTAKEKIETATYPLEGTEPNVYFAAAEIKAKKTGGAVQGGASLITGANKPATDDKEEEPTKPAEKDEKDPAGTANEAGASAFTDVDKEKYAWAYDGIDALAKAGVIKGMTATTFGPELTATNAQMVALAVRIAGLTAENAKTDKVDAEHWVAAEMAIADAKGILTVFGDKVDVEADTTREVAFTLLYNALKAAGIELPETAEAIEFTDASSIDAACVEAINALVKAGIVNGMGDGTLAPKATLTRAQLAKILGMANALIEAK